VVEAITSMGLDGLKIVRDAGYDTNLLEMPDAVMPDELVYILLHKARQISGKPDFGLLAAKKFKPAAFGAMGYSMMTAPTLEDALIRTMRYSGSVTQACTTQLHQAEEGGARCFEFIYQPPAVPDTHQTHEFLSLFTVNFLRWSVGFELNPIRVEFEHTAPKSSQTHREYFRCPVLFNAGRNTLVFNHEQLALPLITADAVMAVFHDRYAEERMAQLGCSPFTLQTRRLITQMLPEGEPSRQLIAQMLNTNERTLQGRLLEEGASYKDILDEIRLNLSKFYLANPNITLQEATGLLGFSERSRFNRAVRRWFDCSPGEMRMRLRADKSTRA
jgi:AraC-like DNA-binding protein